MEHGNLDTEFIVILYEIKLVLVQTKVYHFQMSSKFGGFSEKKRLW